MNHLPVLAWKIASLPMTIISSVLRLVSSAISLLLPYSLSRRGEGSSLVDEMETSALEAMRFVTMFENEYGDRHPSFVAKSFTDVLHQSERESKLMFVYLHSPGHPDTDTFCGETLCSRILVDFVNENFVAWGGSIEASEGFKMSDSLKASRFPFCAVVRPASNQRFALLQQIEGPKSPEEMLTVFQRVLEESSRVPVAARPETDKRTTNFPFREELDFARQAALETGQEIVMKPMEELLVLNTSNTRHNNNINNHSNLSLRSSFEKLHRPEEAATLNCPRCNSTNTRFCYYNNYSLAQPRYFCKSCRRYWTAAGGKLRNKNHVRKNKRSSLSSSSSESSEKLPELAIPSSSTLLLSSPNSKIISPHKQNLNFEMPNFDAILNPASNTITSSSTGITSSRGTMNSFMLNPNPIPDPLLMFPMSEFKIPSLGLYENENGRVVFPFEELKTNASTSQEDQQVMIKEDQNCDSNGFGSGMIGGGSW